MIKRDPERIGFFGVAILLILAGVTVFCLGGVMWLFNCFGDTVFSAPSTKVMGGLIILALGYVVLELEFIRKK